MKDLVALPVKARSNMGAIKWRGVNVVRCLNTDLAKASSY